MAYGVSSMPRFAPAIVAPAANSSGEGARNDYKATGRAL